MIAASEAILPLIPRNNTVAVNAQSGTPRIAFLIAAVSNPTPSANPIAICMASTRPSAEKPWKFFSKFSSSHTIPSLLKIAFARTVSPVVGLITWTPARLHTVLIPARIRQSHRNIIYGCGSLLPTVSITSRIFPPFFFSTVLFIQTSSSYF